MEEYPRCKKCRRVEIPNKHRTRNEAKMCGSICCIWKSARTRIRQNSGRAYQGTCSNYTQAPLFPGDLPTKRLSKRELVCRQREERRRSFEMREPFQCGLLLPKRKPLVYAPLVDGLDGKLDWKSNLT